MKAESESKNIYFEWVAPARYFEKKPPSYFRAVIVLGVLLSLLFYFFNQQLLIMVCWVIVFVVYVKATVPPPELHYSLTQFGLQFLNEIYAYKSFTAFSVEGKSRNILLHFFGAGPRGLEFSVVLPNNRGQATKIIVFLKNKIPFIEKMPPNTIERTGKYLTKLVGFD
jgi:hypothetical protein